VENKKADIFVLLSKLNPIDKHNLLTQLTADPEIVKIPQDITNIKNLIEESNNTYNKTNFYTRGGTRKRRRNRKQKKTRRSSLKH